MSDEAASWLLDTEFTGEVFMAETPLSLSVAVVSPLLPMVCAGTDNPCSKPLSLPGATPAPLPILFRLGRFW